MTEWRNRKIACSRVAVAWCWGLKTHVAGEVSRRPTPPIWRGAALGAQRWNVYLRTAEMTPGLSPAAECGREWRGALRRHTLTTRVGRRDARLKHSGSAHQMPIYLKWRPS